MAISHLTPKASPSITLDFAESKKLDSRLKFSRSGSASYIDGSGLIKIAPTNTPRFNHKPIVITNKIRKSEEFNDATYWASDNSGLTITANSITSPSNTLTADTLAEANTNTVHNRYQNVGFLSTSSRYTFSVYIKPNTVTRVRLGLGYAGLGGGGSAIFNLSSGTVVSTSTSGVDPGTNLSARIVPLSNGWYRCSLTLTPSIGNLHYFTSITLINSSNADIYQGNTANNLYVWGAQLETGSIASNYIPNRSTADKSETKVESIGLLIEKPATNLIDFSEFTTGSWTGNGVGWIALYTPNTTETLDPEGTNTAAKVYQNGTGWQRITKTISTPDGVGNPHTWSIFVKRGNSDVCVIEHTGGWTQGGRVTWNFATETFTSGSPLNFGNYTYEKYPNGWYRISATFIPGTTSGNAWVFPGRDYDGASEGAFTYVWGYQLEVIAPGAVSTNAAKIALGAPTSYIYCNGAATTRNADYCFMDMGFRTNCNYDQHSVVTKFTTNSYPVQGYENKTPWALFGAGSMWNVWWETGPYRYSTLTFTVLNGYDLQSYSTRQLTRGETVLGKTAGRRNDQTIILNDEETFSDTSSQNAFFKATILEVGSFGNFHHLNGSISRLMYYPKRVNNLELKEVL